MALIQLAPPTAEPVTRQEVRDYLRLDGTDDYSIIDGLIVAARKYAEMVTRRQLVTATWRLTLDKFPRRLELPFAPLSHVVAIRYIDTDGTLTTLGAWGGRTLAFTADAPTDLITAAAHGLQTGDALQVSTTGTLPGGLSAVTTYFAERASDSTAYLHTARCTALAGATASRVNLTSAGSGTHSLLVGNTMYDVCADSEPARIVPVYGGSWPTTRAIPGALAVEYVCGYGPPAYVPDGLKTAIKMLVGHLYEHREASTPAKIEVVPLAVESLLWQYRVMELV